MRRFAGSLCLAALWAALYSCSSPISSEQYSLSYPTAFAVVCQVEAGGGYVGAHSDECAGDADGPRLTAFVANGPSGDIGIIDLASGDAVDLDPMIPGYTRLHVGTYIADIAAEVGGRFVHALDTVEMQLISVDTGTYDVVRTPLPALATRIMYAPAQGQLVLSFPELSALGRVSLTADGLPADIELLEIGGSPSAVVASPDGTLIVGHLREQHVTVLDGASFAVIKRIGLVPACRDGLDNDDDGFIDGRDDGCMRGDDQDESDAPVVCAPGEDPVDGEDGLSCVVVEELPACGNDLDDDDDGLTDLDDPGCADRLDFDESTEADFDEATILEFLPCSNGVDDDGDGLADLAQDSDCYGAGALSERGLPAPGAEIAVGPDGRFAYVSHKGLLVVAVLDLQTGRLVDVNNVGDEMYRRMRRKAGEWALEFAYEPGPAAFHVVDETTYAYTCDFGGRCSRLLVSEGDIPAHQPDSATEEDARTMGSKPRLYIDGEELQMGYTPVAGYPNLGPLLVETIDEEENLKRYYGLEFTDDLRVHRNETWTVSYEGRLPGISDMRAVQVGENELVVIGGNLCEAGALAGYSFTFVAPDDVACDVLEAGMVYDYKIESVGGDRVVLAADSGWTEDEEEEGRIPVGDVAAGCLAGSIEFSVRPASAFVVSGSRTGYLHNIVDSMDGCVPDEGGDPLFNGLAHAATLKTGKTLADCPVTSAVESLAVQPFANPLFSFTLYPACVEELDSSIHLVEHVRGTIWTFAVTSGFSSQTISAVKMPVDVSIWPDSNKMYILDLAARSVRVIDLVEFLLEAVHY